MPKLHSFIIDNIGVYAQSYVLHMTVHRGIEGIEGILSMVLLKYALAMHIELYR